jgi:hypothetical protein
MEGNAVSRFAATFVTDTTNPPRPLHPRLRRGRFDLVEVADVILAVIFFAVANSVLLGDEALQHHARTALMVPLAFFTAAPLALRTRFPLAAWFVSVLAAIASSLVISAPILFAGGYLVVFVLVNGLCLYSVTVRCRPRITVTAIVIIVAGAAILDPGSGVVAVFLTAIPVLLGAVVRQRRSGERQLAEQELRHSGERALLEERQRIARELHDVVAHHMSVIAIQAEAAPYKIADPPPELVESFGDIRASALAGMSELRRVLGVLRADRRDTAPQPGLGPGAAAGRRGPIRLSHRAGGAEQRHAACAGVERPGARGLPTRRRGPRRLQRPGPGHVRCAARWRPWHHRHAGACHDAGREPGCGPDRRRGFHVAALLPVSPPEEAA